MLKYMIIFFIISSSLFAQTDWEHWGKAEISYEIKKDSFSEETKVENPGFVAGALSLLRAGYAFLISDVDGDNCPFYPSCSNFFVKAVKEEGLFKGILMFADRFTRDMNILKSSNQYPLHASGRFYDPVENYSLIESKIIYYPREKSILIVH